MRRSLLLFAACLSAAPAVVAQKPPDPVAQAIAQGDLFESHKKFDLALDSYRKADSLSHHSSAHCYMKMAGAERKLGDSSSAINDSKKAAKLAGDDHSLALEAYLFQASLLSQLAGKPNDKKLREAEDVLRQALALDSKQALAHFDLGVILIRQERDSDGIAELKTYASLPGADPKMVSEANRIIANPIRGREPFAPDFSFVTLENQTLSNASLHGKVVLLDFWGTWCPPCRESVPAVRNIEKKFADKQFQLVGVSSDDDDDVWRTFVAAQHMDWAEYRDSSDKVQQAFQIESFPTYVVMDRDGVIRFRQSGFGEGSQSDLEDAINSALKRKPDPALAAAAASPAMDTRPTEATAEAPAIVPAPAPVPSSSPIANPAAELSSATPLEAVEAGSISAGVYKNPALAMTYEFPHGWLAAKAIEIHDANARGRTAAAATILQQHPEVDVSRIIMPKLVFYASRRGEGDGQKLSMPCLRIMAAPTRFDTPSDDMFNRVTQDHSTRMNMKIIAGPMKFKVKEHEFVRADFQRSTPSEMYQAYIQTVAQDQLLTIEIFAATTDELQKIADSLQSMEISNADQ